MRARPDDVADLFVYVVVLNLAIEYVPSVISESFTLSLLTAALLKVTLELVIGSEHDPRPAVRRHDAAYQDGGRSVAVGGRCGQQDRRS